MPLNNAWLKSAKFPKLFRAIRHTYSGGYTGEMFYIPDGTTYPEMATRCDPEQREELKTLTGVDITHNSTNAGFTADLDFETEPNAHFHFIGTTAATASVITAKHGRVFVPMVIGVLGGGSGDGHDLYKIRFGLTGRDSGTGGWAYFGNADVLMRAAMIQVTIGSNAISGRAGMSDAVYQQIVGNGSMLTETVIDMPAVDEAFGIYVTLALMIDHETGTVSMMGPDGTVYPVGPFGCIYPSAGLNDGLFPYVGAFQLDSNGHSFMMIDMPNNDRILNDEAHPITGAGIFGGFKKLVEGGWVNAYDHYQAGNPENVLWCIQYK